MDEQVMKDGLTAALSNDVGTMNTFCREQGLRRPLFWSVGRLDILHFLLDQLEGSTDASTEVIVEKQ